MGDDNEAIGGHASAYRARRFHGTDATMRRDVIQEALQRQKEAGRTPEFPSPDDAGGSPQNVLDRCWGR